MDCCYTFTFYLIKMCNLNLFIKTKQPKGEDLLNLVSFLNVVSAKSFCYNNDGEGIYTDNDNSLIISKKKINLFRKSKIREIQKSNFILMHERLTTSGKSIKYTQPLRKEEFIFLHNGIMSQFDINKRSDSYNLFLEFLQNFREDKTKNRSKRVVECLKQVLSKQIGSFSCALFDTTTKTLYYFKNDTTSIYFYQKYNKEQLYITTSVFNEDFLNVFNLRGFNEKKVKDFSIYSIKVKQQKIKIDVVGKLKKSLMEYTFEKESTTERAETEKYYLDYDQDREREHYNKAKKDDWFYSCATCGELTQDYDNITKEFLCVDCIKYDLQTRKHKQKSAGKSIETIPYI